ncbi:MAG: MotA/TolQ/ExbB proton channel family protein [Bdellovibrionales bacterium]|nr:MotA/TolQ/ExbB proton channel family protein [Bdellovibrionales bacterium]
MTLLIGFLLTSAVFVFSMGLENTSMYFNLHSFVLVAGGTATIFIFSNPWVTVKHLAKSLMQFWSSDDSFEQIRKELIQLAKNKNKQIKVKNDLVNYAQDLWTQGVTQDLFVVLLSQRRKEIEQRSVDAIQSLKNLAKYPPALGMAGTVIGMVSLFSSLDGSKQNIGPALALAMTATFLGLALANALIMPLSDHLQVRHIREKNDLVNLYQIILLINQNEASQLVEDEVHLRGA